MTSAPTTTTTTTTTSTTTAGTGNTTAGSSGSTGMTMPKPDGETCMSAAECENTCFLVPLLGGVCGECAGDADCMDGGCNLPNPITGVGSTCNMGELGGGCETTAVCDAGLTCATLLDVGGIITVGGCSECEDDMGCTAPQLCNANIDAQNLRGQKECIDAGTVANGDTCDIDSMTADMACMSGYCEVADIAGMAMIGVCSECRSDADCMGGMTCDAASIDIATLMVIPRLCV